MEVEQIAEKPVDAYSFYSFTIKSIIMKRLFDDKDQYTPEGNKLGDEVDKALRPIIDKWFDEGYSARDIQYIIEQEASINCLFKLI